MQKTIMVLIIAAALATGAHRFLPASQQARLQNELHSLQQQLVPSVTAAEPKSTEPKKYRLVAPEAPVTETADPILGRNEHAERTTLPVPASAYVQHLQNVRVQGEGRVIKVLADDNAGNRHQRFLVRTTEDVTVLIAHNISLAPRINDLVIGDTVSFSGEYIWNEKGGLVHWTHRDPQGRYPGGWIKHNGKTYQ